MTTIFDTTADSDAVKDLTLPSAEPRTRFPVTNNSLDLSMLLAVRNRRKRVEGKVALVAGYVFMAFSVLVTLIGALPNDLVGWAVRVGVFVAGVLLVKLGGLPFRSEERSRRDLRNANVSVLNEWMSGRYGFGVSGHNDDSVLSRLSTLMNEGVVIRHTDSGDSAEYVTHVVFEGTDAARYAVNAKNGELFVTMVGDTREVRVLRKGRHVQE